MKKAILGLAFLTIASFSFSAVAQNKSDKTCKSETECVAKNKKCCKGENKKECGKKCVHKCKKADLFEGITLTSEQKKRIEALDNSMKTYRQELKAQVKTARENKDTSFNLRNSGKKLRSKYINDLGEILTSDQMVVYLKNFYINSGSHRCGKKAFAMKQGKRLHDGKCPHKGQSSVR